MLAATTVTSKNELDQIHQLNLKNLKQNLKEEEQIAHGFVTWVYPPLLLEQMNELAPSIIVKDDEVVAGYALTTLKESSVFHPDLETMFHNLNLVDYNGRPLFSYRFYCMGQICVAKEYRRRGIVKQLYDKHRDVYADRFDFILTEVSTRNKPSIAAHEKLGFKTIYTYSDAMDEWNVVIWDWK